MERDTPLHHPKSFENGVDYEHFSHLRKNNPIFKQSHDVYPEGYWNLTRHEDVVYVSRHSQILTCPNTPNTCLLYTSPSPRD